MKSLNTNNKILKTGFKCYCLLMVLPLLQLSCSRDQEKVITVMKGHFRQSVTESGELQAANSSLLTMPKINYIYGSTFKIIELAEHGKNVHKGDPVVKFDPASVHKYIIERQESLENEIASANKLKAQLNNNLQDLKAQLRNEQALYDIKNIQVQKSQLEYPALRRVLELEFRQEEIKISRLKRNLLLRPKLDSLDFRIQQIKVDQKENELKAAQETLAKLVIYSPLDGIFVIEKNRRTNQPYKIGDEVYLSYPVATIPDIRTMKAIGFIMENDISRIKPGQDVLVRLDALPSVPFHGKISKISKVCVERETKKVFLTEVLISESDPRLKPGMTVSCEYITYEGNDETYVPSNCILEENRHFYLFVKRRGKIRKTEVKTGPSNNMYTIVSGEIIPGQALIAPEKIITAKM